MARAGEQAAVKFLELLTRRQGLNSKVAALSELEGLVLPAIGEKQILTQNVSFELIERSMEARYPALNVYCEKISNLLREKFRTFSGKAQMAVEVRLSQDRLEGLEKKLHLYVDAVTQVLDQNRGDWGNGLYYAGGYDAVFNPVKHGGKNLIQIAKISFEVGVSSN